MMIESTQLFEAKIMREQLEARLKDIIYYYGGTVKPAVQERNIQASYRE